MNKYLQLHIEQASYATRRRLRMATIISKLLAYVLLGYAVVIGLWWCIVVVFAMTPGM